VARQTAQTTGVAGVFPDDEGGCMNQVSSIDVGGAKGVAGRLPAPFRETLGIRLWAFLKIPMLAFVRPSVVELNNDRVVIRLRLTRRTKNHLGSMYFAALCAGADAAGGLIAFRMIQKSGKKVSLIFKSFEAEFLKRPEGDVHFTCEEGAAIRALVERVIASGEREHIPVHVTATVPAKFGDEPVAKFVLTLSLKARGQK
jgi:acyl-coenzyme A thioesterase PaaI-like protein